MKAYGMLFWVQNLINFPTLYLLFYITRKIGNLKTHSSIHCLNDNWENLLNFRHTLDRIYLTSILCVQCLQISLYNYVIMTNTSQYWIHQYSGQHLDQNLSSQKTPHSSPLWVSYGASVARNFEKNNGVIMALSWIMHCCKCHDIFHHNYFQNKLIDDDFDARSRYLAHG